jgi:hypothetical protein
MDSSDTYLSSKLAWFHAATEASDTREWHKCNSDFSYCKYHKKLYLVLVSQTGSDRDKDVCGLCNKVKVPELAIDKARQIWYTLWSKEDVVPISHQNKEIVAWVAYDLAAHKLAEQVRAKTDEWKGLPDALKQHEKDSKVRHNCYAVKMYCTRHDRSGDMYPTTVISRYNTECLICKPPLKEEKQTVQRTNHATLHSL